MTFFCFLESANSSVPHMEPLDAESLEEARQQAKRLLSRHTQAMSARIYLDAEEVDVLARSAIGP